MKTTSWRIRRQGGAVAIIAAISLPVLIGFAGLAVDLGHLYVEKTELQNATDACALAAARELTCDPSAGPCAASFLLNAENSGRTVAARNKVNFQGTGINIPPENVKFSTTFNSAYFSRTNGADPASKYVMCTAQQTGIVPWFMQVLGVGTQTVGAQAVATLIAAQTNCALPIGLCKLPAGTPADPLAGMRVGQWMTSKLSQSATGSFGWIDFTPSGQTPGCPGGGAAELGCLIKGTGACSVPPPPTLVGQQGNIDSLAKAWNTRFGLYKGSDDVTTSPPDFTGESYTPTTWTPGENAYGGSSTIPNFLAARDQHLPYQSSPPSGFKNSTSAQLKSSGTDRRIATVPVVDCSNWAASNPQQVPVLGYACILMLHPITRDDDEVRLEFRGKASAGACATAGSVGGPGSLGPLVPALVQ